MFRRHGRLAALLSHLVMPLMTIRAGHSLRAGFLTSAAKRGASIFKMMDVSRHRSVDTLRSARFRRLHPHAAMFVRAPQG
jgi:hypothetical protein